MAGSGDEIIIRSEKIYKVGARRERSPSVLPIVWSRAEIVRDGKWSCGCHLATI